MPGPVTETAPSPLLYVVRLCVSIRGIAFLLSLVVFRSLRCVERGSPADGSAASGNAGGASPIKQASFTHAAAGDDAAQTIHFGRQAARVGDRIEQNMSLEMRMKLTMRRENELVGNNQTTVRTKQHRIVVATAVESGMTMAARVQYPEATKQVIAAEATSGSAQVARRSTISGGGAAGARENVSVPALAG